MSQLIDELDEIIAKFERDGTSNATVLFENDQGDFYLGLNGEENFSISRAANMTDDPKFVIDGTSGNVGLGITAPETELHIQLTDGAPVIRVDQYSTAFTSNYYTDHF